MRILFVIPYAPSPVRVRPYHFVGSLLSDGHDVTLASPWATERDRSDLDILRSKGARVVERRIGRFDTMTRVLRAAPTSWPLQAAYSWSPALCEDVRSIARSGKVDVAHVEHLRGARYAISLADERRSGHLEIPVVWDSVDCVSHLLSQAALQSRSALWRRISHLELARTRRTEARLATSADRVIVTSARDRKALEGVVKREAPDGLARFRCSVVSNGVDADQFPAHFGARPPATLTFTGKMSYHANVTGALFLLDEIMPLVWEKRPETNVQIVGRGPTAQIRTRARHHGSRVSVTGEVPKICPFLRRSTLAVASLPYGVGVQNKVLEAMSTATPVVATSSAVEGLDTCAGQDLVVADGSREIANVILELLADPDRCKELGRAGRAYVERYHRWEDVARSLVTVYQDAVKDAE